MIFIPVPFGPESRVRALSLRFRVWHRETGALSLGSRVRVEVAPCLLSSVPGLGLRSAVLGHQTRHWVFSLESQLPSLHAAGGMARRVKYLCFPLEFAHFPRHH